MPADPVIYYYPPNSIATKYVFRKIENQGNTELMSGDGIFNIGNQFRNLYKYQNNLTYETTKTLRKNKSVKTCLTLIQKSALKSLLKIKNMTTTLTKKNDASSNMSFFTAMESVGFKTVSILVILILNTTTLSSQTNGMVCGSRLGIKSGIVPEKPRTLTLYSAQNFPVIQISSNHALHKMDDFDNFDYEKIFCSNTVSRITTGPGSNSFELTNTYNKNVKAKIPSKLN